MLFPSLAISQLGSLTYVFYLSIYLMSNWIAPLAKDDVSKVICSSPTGGAAFFMEKISNFQTTIDFVINVGLWLRLVY